MIKKLKNLMLAAGLLFAVATPAVAVAGTTYAADSPEDCTNIAECASGGVDSTGDQQQDTSVETVNNLAKTVINIFSWVVGIISVIMVIVGGFQYITSGGDSGKVTNAKNTIMYALIGIVIVALSQIMVQFVLEKLVDAA